MSDLSEELQPAANYDLCETKQDEIAPNLAVELNFEIEARCAKVAVSVRPWWFSSLDVGTSAAGILSAVQTSCVETREYTSRRWI